MVSYFLWVLQYLHVVKEAKEFWYWHNSYDDEPELFQLSTEVHSVCAAGWEPLQYM